MCDQPDEVAKLRAAIKAAGFSVMETSGEWSIFDVSEAGKAADAKCLEVAMRNVELEQENKRLHALIHTPHTEDWLTAVPLEAAFQIENWGTDHDHGKDPQDWFWLLGFLAGKAVRSHSDGDLEKAKHHTISTAAVLLNWHRRLSGMDFSFTPGLSSPPAEEGQNVTG